MKSTTKPRRAQAGPTLLDLMAEKGLTPARIEVDHLVSCSTVFRAMRGVVPGPLHLRVLSAALGVSEADCRTAIERSAKVA